MSEPKRRAYERAERQVLPTILNETMADLAYWTAKRNFWQVKVAEADASPTEPPWGPTARRKLVEITEILDVFTQDARQINQKLAK